jgi:hypothetical protein
VKHNLDDPAMFCLMMRACVTDGLNDTRVRKTPICYSAFTTRVQRDCKNVRRGYVKLLRGAYLAAFKHEDITP